jgi:hypothetical protein
VKVAMSEPERTLNDLRPGYEKSFIILLEYAASVGSLNPMKSKFKTTLARPLLKMVLSTKPTIN